jgi:hypothetical protein
VDQRGELEKATFPMLGRDTAEHQLATYSSRFFDAVQLLGRTGQSDAFLPAGVTDPMGNFADDLYAMTHYWQIDDLAPDELQPAVERLHAHLVAAGWALERFDLPPEVPSAVVIAENPADGYRVYAKGFVPMKRVFFRVTTPVLRVPPGEVNPVTGSAKAA